MKLTVPLWKFHIGRLIKFNWSKASAKVPIQTKAEEMLTSMGYEVKDPLDLIVPKKVFEKIEPNLFYKKIQFNEDHPDWKSRICLIHKDSNLLQSGVSQALLLTKTVQILNELPKRIQDCEVEISEDVHHLVERIIYTSNIFDAYQELLPKRKDPNRPAWVFPRDYGLTDTRKVKNLSKKLFQLCENLNGLRIANKRSFIHDGIVSLSIEKESNLLQFALSYDLLMTSVEPLAPLEEQDSNMKVEFPDISPLHPIIGIEKTNIYKTEDIFPINSGSPYSNIHTIVVCYDRQKVKNLTELPVTEDQILARSLMKSFTAAVGCAHHKYGQNINDLPEPITVQCIQSDGQNFHFSVFQLNTLNIDGTDGIRNFWWSTPMLQLFEEAGYQFGQPVLKEYNPEIIKKIFAFYNNC